MAIDPEKTHFSATLKWLGAASIVVFFAGWRASSWVAGIQSHQDRQDARMADLLDKRDKLEMEHAIAARILSKLKGAEIECAYLVRGQKQRCPIVGIEYDE